VGHRSMEVQGHRRWRLGKFGKFGNELIPFLSLQPFASLAGPWPSAYPPILAFPQIAWPEGDGPSASAEMEKVEGRKSRRQDMAPTHGPPLRRCHYFRKCHSSANVGLPPAAAIGRLDS